MITKQCGNLLFALVLLISRAHGASDPYLFTDADISFLSGFMLSDAYRLPDTPDNKVADDERAAQLGHQLFFDRQLSANGEVSCATCHQPKLHFTDGLAKSVALGTTRRNAPSIPGALYSPWQFWDGRADSLWVQALGPLEDLHEQGLDRTSAARYFISTYSSEYQTLFNNAGAVDVVRRLTIPASPLHPGAHADNWQSLSDAERTAVNQIFANLGKVIMAYERRLTLPPARFDRFVEALRKQAEPSQLQALMTIQEVAGMRLFMGKANCASCHNGPMFSNFEFHNIGAPEPDQNYVDLGRYEGVITLQNSEFTCLSPYSDAATEQCEEMRFLKQQGPELVGAFKTPSLRNVTRTAPYMQSGQFSSLQEIVSHYNKPVPPFYDRRQHPSRPHFDILPLNLTEQEQQQLIAFLDTLTSPIPQDSPWWNTP
ncbi:cytochrome-c peroxidase [Gynuella sunshinyii]|uniref:Cytochrome c peroxidase n=1 Tax=Gynuella sunshinyii YC6258 TaxID=1445510 RepID=A0A0C5VWG9_9GAMM|nr:cytochrome c peroxidase [Gynuella sunshinyii]AJQ97658.1 cytochrome c peroxidase [Gynuella sunshinyii YC6258]